MVVGRVVQVVATQREVCPKNLREDHSMVVKTGLTVVQGHYKLLSTYQDIFRTLSNI